MDVCCPNPVSAASKCKELDYLRLSSMTSPNVTVTEAKVTTRTSLVAVRGWGEDETRAMAFNTPAAPIAITKNI